MELRMKTKSFGSNSGKYDMKKYNEYKCCKGNNIFNSFVLFYVITVCLSILISTESATAQSNEGFLVQPGQIMINGRARQKSVGDLRIHNYDPNNQITVELKLMELTQQEDGAWLPFDTDPCNPFDYYPGLDLSNVSSCNSWVKIDKTSVDIPPGGDAMVGIEITTPIRTRPGVYGAAIVTSMTTRESQNQRVPILIRNVVPVVVNVQLIENASPKVEIQDIGMEFVSAEGLVPGRVLLTMKVKNVGTVFPRLRPIIRLRGFIDGHWKLITTHTFDEVGIIPGVELNLKSDIGKSLPSGKYQLESVLYVNQSLRGRRNRLDKEMEFKGDPMITKTATDVPLDLTPLEVIIPIRPGLKRSGDIKAYSAVLDRILVEPILDVPKAFKDIATAEGKIEDKLSCAKWLSVEPGEVFLENYGGRNLKILAAMPENALEYPNYYALLGLKTSYLDGQSAGTSWVKVCLQNMDAITEPQVVCSAINFEEWNVSESEYIVQATFQNTGKTHIIPSTVRVAVVKSGDTFGRTAAIMNTDTYGMFLPYETRSYRGVLDFSSIEPDNYNLEVLLNSSEGVSVKRQIRLEVKIDGTRRIPVITDKNIESTDFIEVIW